MPSKTHFFFARFARSKRLQNAFETPSKRRQKRIFLARFARKTPSKRLRNAFETPSERRQKRIFSRALRALKTAVSVPLLVSPAVSPAVSQPPRRRSRRRLAAGLAAVAQPSRCRCRRRLAGGLATCHAGVSCWRPRRHCFRSVLKPVLKNCFGSRRLTLISPFVDKTGNSFPRLLTQLEIFFLVC